MTFSDRVKYIRGNIRQKDFAEMLEVSLGAVQHWEIDNQLPRGDVLIKIRDRFNVDLNWLLTGDGNPYIGKNKNIEEPELSQQTNQHQNVIEIQHIDIVRNFKDKPRAKAINQALLELERTSPSAFEAIESYIKGMVSGIQLMAAEPTPSYGERRKNDDPDQIPPEGDRRLGVDRRKAGGG